MGALTRTFQTDEKKEQEGSWITIVVNDDKSIARVRVKRMGPSNKAFTKRYAMLTRQLRAVRGDKEELEKQALIEAFLDHCLVGWENIENLLPVEQGKKRDPYMPFSKENARLLFEKLPEVLDDIVIKAMDVTTFQAEQPETELKNSSPSSNTP